MYVYNFGSHEDDGFHVYPEPDSIAWGISQVCIRVKRDLFIWQKRCVNIIAPLRS
jgi:hypothetical protein